MIIDRLTDWMDEDKTLQSGYGTIPYSEWCVREILRINQNEERDAFLDTRIDPFDNRTPQCCIADRKPPELIVVRHTKGVF